MRRYLVLAPLLCVAAPASAQFWGGPSIAPSPGSYASRARPSIEMRGGGETGRIRNDIRDGRESGQLSRREARRLKREAYQIDALESRYGRDGLSGAEQAELAARREALRNDVTAQRSGQRKK